MKTKQYISRISLLILVLWCACSPQDIEGPFFATGIKIGELTQTSAIVWVRLTKNSDRIGNEAPLVEVIYKDPESSQLISGTDRPDVPPIVIFPDGYDIHSIQGAVPGTSGKVRLKYKPKDDEDWIQIDWRTVDPEKDYTHQFHLTDLLAGGEYEILLEASSNKNNKVSASVEGKFKTPPSADVAAQVNFIVTTGTSYPDVDSESGYKLYPNALKLDPEFFVHTGDIIYYDALGKTADLARWHWDRMYSYPNNIEFHKQVASYFIKDDHDTWVNDCYPGMETRFMGEFTYDQGTQIFLEEVPMGEKTFRTVRWGKDLQIWLVEGRDFRSPNPEPDGPEKSIWGKEQLQWFMKTVMDSDATFKVLISPTPIVGPDRTTKNDNYANSGFTYEGDMIRQFISEQKNMVVVCGDRHWQYISKDIETGILEFSCGPASNAHAGGWKQENILAEHLYLNVVGGFLEGSVLQESGVPVLVFRHYNPDGQLLNEYSLMP